MAEDSVSGKYNNLKKESGAGEPIRAFSGFLGAALALTTGDEETGRVAEKTLDKFNKNTDGTGTTIQARTLTLGN